MSKGKTTWAFTVKHTKHYGFWKFIGDVVMTIITSGLWLIWVVIRHIKNK